MQILFAHISEALHQQFKNICLPLLDKAFHERICRYKRWEDQQAGILGRMLLMECMKRAGIQIEINKMVYSAFGKPYFEHRQIHFNISHSGDFVICALSTEFNIGIDIEKAVLVNLDDFRFQIADADWNNIQASQYRIEEFYKYWTQKEALLKALGTGLNDVVESYQTEQITADMVRCGTFMLQHLKIASSYYCCIAAETDNPANFNSVPVKIYGSDLLYNIQKSYGISDE